MTFILWLIAVVLVIWGIVTLVRGSVLFGILLIVAGRAGRRQHLRLAAPRTNRADGPDSHSRGPVCRAALIRVLTRVPGSACVRHLIRLG